MDLVLGTRGVWELEPEFRLAEFFRVIRMLIDASDVIVIGAYNPGKEARDWLKAHELEIPKPFRPWTDTFEINRDDYPNGRAYALKASELNLLQLVRLAEKANDTDANPLFFDHVAAYRPGKQPLPLFCFHDASTGGYLYLVGHYRDTMVQPFAQALGVPAKYIENPES